MAAVVAGTIGAKLVAGLAKSEVPSKLVEYAVGEMKDLSAHIQNAVKLDQFSQVFKAIKTHADEVEADLTVKEKAIIEQLGKARDVTSDAVWKAEQVRGVIKSHTAMLVLNIKNSKEAVSVSAQNDELEQACQAFMCFAEKIKAPTEAAKEALHKSGDVLYHAGVSCKTLVGGLQRIQKKQITECQNAQAKARLDHWWILAGLIVGPLGLIVSVPVTVGVVEGANIPAIEEAFRRQIEIINSFIEAVFEMGKEMRSLEKAVNEKKRRINSIAEQMGTLVFRQEKAIENKFRGSYLGNLLIEAENLLEECGAPL